MDYSNAAKDKLLREIVERELVMFLAAPEEADDNGMRKNPDLFRLMSSMAHSAHGNAFLKSYLDDLRGAEETGRNFIFEKYARMSSPQKDARDNPLLDEIADAEMDFQNEAAELHPDVIQHKASEDFRRFLRSGLESLSDASLNLYAEELKQARKEGRNPVLERHNWLARKLGKDELS